MKESTKLRLTGGGIILINLFIIGWYNIKGLSAITMTLGIAVVFEMFVKMGRKG